MGAGTLRGTGMALGGAGLSLGGTGSTGTGALGALGGAVGPGSSPAPLPGDARPRAHAPRPGRAGGDKAKTTTPGMPRGEPPAPHPLRTELQPPELQLPAGFAAGEDYISRQAAGRGGRSGAVRGRHGAGRRRLPAAGGRGGRRVPAGVPAPLQPRHPGVSERPAGRGRPRGTALTPPPRSVFPPPIGARWPSSPAAAPASASASQRSS